MLKLCLIVLFCNGKCYFQATCNSGLYKPVFHPFLDPVREREVLSVCFSSYFKKQFLSFCFCFNGKDKPHVDLDQMHFAHV